MKKALGVIAILLLVWGTAGLILWAGDQVEQKADISQIVKPSGILAYTPTENQFLRLTVKRLEYQLALEHMQAASSALNAEAKAVAKENGWPDNLQFDFQTLRFNDPPKLPPVKPDAKKP